jgi:phage tail-like protein
MTRGFGLPGATTAILNGPAAIGTALSTSQKGKGTTDPAKPPEYGLTMWFNVKVSSPDGGRADLGNWSGCSGLGVKLDIQEVWSAYNLNAPYLVPHRISYEQVTLQRAMEAGSSQRVQEWLRRVSREWVNHAEGGAGLVETGAAASSGGYTGTAVTVTLYCALDSGKEVQGRATGASKGGGPTVVSSWVLTNAVPVHWAGPALSSKGGDVAIETLKLAHRGWLDTPGETTGTASAGSKTAKVHGIFALSNEKNPSDMLAFQYSPEKVKLENAVETRGDSRLVQTSDLGSVNEFNKWNVTINQLHVEGARKVRLVREKLRTWMDLQIQSGTDKGKAVPAPRLKISFGSTTASDIPTVNLKSVSIDLVRFTADGTPNRAIVTISVVAAKEEPPTRPRSKPEPAPPRPTAQPRANTSRDLRTADL